MSDGSHIFSRAGTRACWTVKALVGSFFVIVKPSWTFVSSYISQPACLAPKLSGSLPPVPGLNTVRNLNQELGTGLLGRGEVCQWGLLVSTRGASLRWNSAVGKPSERGR